MINVPVVYLFAQATGTRLLTREGFRGNGFDGDTHGDCGHCPCDCAMQMELSDRRNYSEGCPLRVCDVCVCVTEPNADDVVGSLLELAIKAV